VRALSATIRALIAAQRYRFAGKCELVDQNGMWRDVTNWFGTNWFTSATWNENLDQPVATGSITLAREDRGISLSPYIGASPVNQVGVAFEPFIREGQGFRLKAAITAPGVPAAAGDFFEVWTGTVDDFTLASDKNDLVLNTRDPGARIVDAQIEEKKTYAPGEDGGVPLETVVQQMLDDVLGVGAVVLYVPVSPGTLVTNVDVDDGTSLMTAIRDVALRIGWDIRYRYAFDGTMRLTLWQPPRAAGGGDELIWFAASEYIAIPKLSTSIIDVRNAIAVEFTNADTGKPDKIVVKDDVSILARGRRYAALSFSATSQINTADEATTLGNIALGDLSTPFSDHDVELFPMFYAVQLGDYYGFRANGKVYDADNAFGVFGFTHTMENASGSTTLTTKGKVVGAFKEWTRRSRSEFGEASPSTEDTRKIALKNFREIYRTPTKVRFGWDLDDPNPIAEVDGWKKLSDQDTDPPTPPGTNDDRLWRDIETEKPDTRLEGDTITFDVDVPPHGKIQTWELMPFGADGEKGFGQRIKVLATPDIPRFGKLETQIGATGLFLDIVRLDLDDPQALGGTLSVWLNYDMPVDPDPTGAPDGTLAIAITPHTVVTAEAFTLPDGVHTSQLFDNIRIHPDRGKRIYVEFVNVQGISSGQVSYDLLSNGAIIDQDGNMIDGAITRAAQFAATIQPVSVYDTLPPVGRANEVAVLTSDKKLYRWNGTTWTSAVPAPDISGVLTSSQIADAAITTAKFALTIRPVELLSSLPSAPGANRIALSSDGKLYRSTTDGTGWTAAVPTVDLSGTINSAQIADAAITATKLGAAAVTTAAIANAAITNALIAASAVTSTTIADGSISTPKIVAGAVTATEIGASAITAAKVAANAITAGAIASGAVTAGTIAAGAVTAGTVAASAITATELAAGAVTTTRLAAGAVTANELAANAVIAGKVSAGAISTTELAAGAVNASKIASQTITSSEIAANTISGGNIAGRTISASNIISGTLTSNELAANSIIAGKIAAGAINAGSIIVDGIITAAKLNVTQLSQISSNAGIIVSGKLQDATGGRYLDLSATGSNPFLHHPSFDLFADGSANFSGVVSSTSFTGSGALFTNGVTVNGTLFVTSSASLAFNSAAGPRVFPNGGDLVLSGSTSGTTLTGSVKRSVGGVPGTPIPVPGVVVDTSGAGPSNAGNYRAGDLWIDTVNVRAHVHSGSAWTLFSAS
jgi:hypothetical protein